MNSPVKTELQEAAERVRAAMAAPMPGRGLVIVDPADLRTLIAAAEDGERWRVARQFLAVEDIEEWTSREWSGHVPDEKEAARADAAIDSAIAAKGK